MTISKIIVALSRLNNRKSNYNLITIALGLHIFYRTDVFLIYMRLGLIPLPNQLDLLCLLNK